MVHHLVFVTGSSIGHITPLVALAAKLVHENPEFTITVPVLGDYGKIAEKMLLKHFTEDKLHLRENVRLINLGGEGKDPFPLIGHLITHYEAFYSSLYAEEDVKCATGRVYSAIPKPRMVLLDCFLYDLLLVSQKISQHHVPIFGWLPFGTGYTLYYYAPEKYGGRGDLSQKAAILSEKNGSDFEKVEAELYFSYSAQGEVVRLPGLPPVYDYEIVQRDDISLGTLSSFTLQLIKTTGKFLRECDGAVSTSNNVLEPEINAAFREWFSETNKSSYFIGPVLPPDTPELSSITKKQDLGLSEDGNKAQAFLDRILQSHGEKSMLNIAFGSFFWPPGDSVWTVLETIIEMKIPFILSYVRGELPPRIKALVDSYQDCIVPKWAPQHVILSHKATGWFMTHCGLNSTSEAIFHGVPMIAWPIHGDQPALSISISAVLDVAYRLVEGGIGSGLLPRYGGYQPKGTSESVVQEFKDVWAKAQGEDGARKRLNVQILQEKVRALWKVNGSSLRNFKTFADYCSKN